MPSIINAIQQTLQEVSHEYFIASWEIKQDGTIVEKISGEIYLRQHPHMIRLECFGVFLGKVLFGSLLPIVLTIKLTIVLFKDIAQIFNSTYSTKFIVLTLAEDLVNGTIELGLNIIINLGITLGSIYGIICPYYGMRLVGKLEKLYIDGDTDILYLAPSFQPLTCPHVITRKCCT